MPIIISRLENVTELKIGDKFRRKNYYAVSRKYLWKFGWTMIKIASYTENK